MRNNSEPGKRNGCQETMGLLGLVRRYRRDGPFEKNDPMLERFKSSEALRLTRKMTEEMSPQETEKRWLLFLETRLVRGEVSVLLDQMRLEPHVRQLAENIVTSRVMRRKDDIAELTCKDGRSLRDVASEEIANHFEWQSATV